MSTAEHFKSFNLFPAGVCAEEGESIIDDWDAPIEIPQLALLRGFNLEELMALLWNAKAITATTTPNYAFGSSETEFYLASDNGAHAAGINGAQIVDSELTEAPAPRGRVCEFTAADYTDSDLYSSAYEIKTGRTWHLSQNQVPYFAGEDGGFELTLEIARILKQGDEYAVVIALRLKYVWAYAGASGSEELSQGSWAVLIPNSVASETYEDVGGAPTLLQTFDATVFGRDVTMYFYTGSEGFSAERTGYVGTTDLTIEISESYTY